MGFFITVVFLGMITGAIAHKKSCLKKYNKLNLLI